MINKTYDDFIKNTEAVSSIAFKGEEAITITREGMPDLILVSAELLNSQVSDLVDLTAIECAERSEKAGLPRLTEEDLERKISEMYENGRKRMQNRISS